MERIADDHTVRAVVVASTGSVFSAGGDFDFMLKANEDLPFLVHHAEIGKRLLMSVVDSQIPVVAAVHGPAVGLGATVALACDCVVAARSAMFSDPHVRVGLVAGDGGCLVWPAALGLTRARRYLLTGDALTAEDAYQFGAGPPIWWIRQTRSAPPPRHLRARLPLFHRWPSKARSARCATSCVLARPKSWTSPWPTKSPRHSREISSRRYRPSARSDVESMSAPDTRRPTTLPTSLATTPPAESVDAGAIGAEVDALWRVFRSDRTVDLAWRRDQLQGVRSFLNANRDRILSALAADLGKPAFEAYAADVGAVLSEARLLNSRLATLIKPRKVRTPALNMPATSWIYPEPVGPVLLLPAWNYPFGLALLPLLGALAAGNPIALKPSELAPRSAELMAEMLQRYVDSESVKVFEGGPECARALLRQRFGHIHYTGSSAVGRLVMEAAAAHLTPVTLELGGKNPAYVHASADVEVAGQADPVGPHDECGPGVPVARLRAGRRGRRRPVPRRD